MKLYNFFWLLFILSILLTWQCSKHHDHPMQPEPDPPEVCEIERVEGTWVVVFSKDRSAPNSFGLLQNYVVLWDTVDSRPGSGEIEVRIEGTYHPEDVIEGFSSGSSARIRYWFEPRQ